MRTKDKIIDELLRTVEEQRQGIIFLKERISELERRLNSNSQNSSKPPSSDGLRKPNPKSLREKGKNKSGGQPKHRGDTLYQSLHPDRIVEHKIDFCPCCNKDMRRKPRKGFIKRQVFDILMPKIEITEHQAEIKYCTHCNHKITAAFPREVQAPVQYGSRIKAFAIYLQNQHFLPEARLKMIFRDIFNLPIACATLSNFSAGLSLKLTGFLGCIDDALYRAKIKHLDETSLRVEGKQYWLHVGSTKLFTSYRISRNRGDVPDALLGQVIHDHFRPYFCIKKAKHGVCNSHILRELVGIMDEDQERWAKRMFRLLKLACRLKNKYPGAIPNRWTEFIRKNYFRIVTQGLSIMKT